MNPFKMVKQAATMHREMRSIQKQLEKQTCEYTTSDGRIKVVARGDMLVESITIDPGIMDPTRPDRLATNLVSAINRALEQAKKKAASEMQKMTDGTSLANLLQGMK